MKIVIVELENINSLAGKWHINFADQLYRSGLFAISGPTGSGKSSILDAISLALYGRTPRLDSRNNLPDIMTKGTYFSLARVVFLINHNYYLAEWSKKRAYQKSDGKPQETIHRLFKRSLVGGYELISNKNNEAAKMVESLCYLDFGRFSQAVLLAQGNFASFIKATGTERSAILEKITQSQRYTKIGEKTYQIFKNEEILLVKLREELGLLTSLSNEDFNFLESKLVKIKMEVKHLEDLIEQSSSLVTDLTQYNKNRQLLLLNDEEQKHLCDAKIEFTAKKELILLDDRLKKVGPSYKAYHTSYNNFVTLEQTIAKIADRLRLIDESIQNDQYAYGQIGEQYRKKKNPLEEELHNYEAQYDQFTTKEQLFDLTTIGDRINDLKFLVSYNLNKKELATLESEFMKSKDRRIALEQLKLEKQLEVYRSRLIEGDTCPLCGSRAHQLAHFSNNDEIDYSEEVASLERQHIAFQAKAAVVKDQEEKNDIIIDVESDLFNVELERLIDLRLLLVKIHNIKSDIVKVEKDEKKSQELLLNSLKISQDDKLKESTAIDIHKEQQKNLSVEVDKNRVNFLAMLLAEGFKTEDQFTVCNHDEGDIARIKEEAKTLEKKESELNSERKRILQELEKKINTEESIDDLRKKITNFSMERDGYLTEKGVIISKIENDKQQKEHHNQILAKIDYQQDVLSKWAKLNNIIGSAKGEKYQRKVQALTFIELLTEANDQLKGLSKRYRLVSKEGSELTFAISDDNYDGTIRSIESLSGGETFLISLSLALALATLSSNRYPINSLFLDEGFGTLDQQSLLTTLDVLKQLPKQGKLIGIISHVEQLKEQIAIQIELIPQGNGYSIIRGPGVSKGFQAIEMVTLIEEDLSTIKAPPKAPIGFLF